MFIRSRRRRRLWSLVVLGTLLLPPGTAMAQSKAELEERIRRLERIIRDAGLDQPAPRGRTPGRAAPVTRQAPPPAEELDKPAVEAIVEEKMLKQKVLAGWKDGFFLESPSGDFKLKLRGYIQTQARIFTNENGDTGTDSIFMRRVRPIFEGTVFKYFDYKIMPDFGQGTTSLQDAYFDITYFKPYVVFRGGKDKVPFSLERLQSGADLLFAERAITQNLGQNRDVGFRLSGSVLDGVFDWQTGVYNGSPDGRSVDGETVDDADHSGFGEFEIAARGFMTPFKNAGISWLEKAGLGMALTYGHQTDGENLNVVNYRTAGMATFFRYRTSTSSTSPISVFADGVRYRLSPQGYYYWGPFGLMGEYVFSSQEAERTATSDDVTTVRKADIENDGWFVQASYVLTGEDASYRGVVPINPFDPYNGRWGAFELAARGSVVNIDPKAFRLGFTDREISTTKASNWAVGLNWYFNKNFKLQLDYEHTQFANFIEFGDEQRDHENVFLMQFQISY
jgi:phosphate-selective porin OprO/OprP